MMKRFDEFPGFAVAWREFAYTKASLVIFQEIEETTFWGKKRTKWNRVIDGGDSNIERHQLARMTPEQLDGWMLSYLREWVPRIVNKTYYEHYKVER